VAEEPTIHVRPIASNHDVVAYPSLRVVNEEEVRHLRRLRRSRRASVRMAYGENHVSIGVEEAGDHSHRSPASSLELIVSRVVRLEDIATASVSLRLYRKSRRESQFGGEIIECPR
jgi:hypothetical protein